MSKDIKLTNAHIMFGDAMERLKELPDNSVDSIVTDPPYGLSDNKYVASTIEKWIHGERYFIPDGKGFMGKAWDSFVPPPAIWDECMRVLKPGGHLLAFFGSRTQDIGALSIRLAGFEIRDSVAWLYGSGFPKSLDISKAIDKKGGTSTDIDTFIEMLKDKKKRSGLTNKEINKALGFAENGGLADHYFRTSEQRMLPAYDKYIILKKLLNISDEWDEWFNSAAEREVIGTTKSGGAQAWINGANNKDKGNADYTGQQEWDITAPATEQAKQYAGWGTALKPAHEPIVVARKPLSESTVANNVLKWGTGGLNIDASRIEGKPRTTHSDGTNRFNGQTSNSRNDYAPQIKEGASGRFPANIILDETTAKMLDEQSGVLTSGGGNKATKNADTFLGTGFGGTDDTVWKKDSGGASRFFYVAKASKKDRNEGLEGLPEKPGPDGMRRNLTPGESGGRGLDRTNFHPTVKPTTLMEYLIKLVTPVGGTVLDPFTGSGSTGKAALLNGFKFIGCELTEEYLPIIEGRLKFAEAKYNEQQLKKEEEEQADTLFDIEGEE